jgi:hypothetical protein
MTTTLNNRCSTARTLTPALSRREREKMRNTCSSFMIQSQPRYRPIVDGDQLAAAG